MGLFERFVVADDVAGDGEEAEVHLDLAGDEETVRRVRPFFVNVMPLGDRRIKEWGLGEGLLHGAFHKAVG
jgi:hypothetical protein